VTLEWEQTIIDSGDPVALGQWWRDALGWVVLTDPEGNEFCVLGSRSSVG